MQKDFGPFVSELAKPNLDSPILSRSSGGHPQREGTNLGLFVPICLVLRRREATNLGTFDLPHSNGGANSGGFGARRLRARNPEKVKKESRGAKRTQRAKNCQKGVKMTLFDSC